MATEFSKRRSLWSSTATPFQRLDGFQTSSRWWPGSPSSTVTSLQSQSSVERENASGELVLGLDGDSGAATEVTDLTGKDAGDGFVCGPPSKNFCGEVLTNSRPGPISQKPEPYHVPAICHWKYGYLLTQVWPLYKLHVGLAISGNWALWTSRCSDPGPQV
ncbi:hypothetical protein ON010_g1246 [Phytophthora cinnamomi]|nr:hypothetical protein ON010_g1246 [Phytophthora cinnamomi]